MTTLTFDIPEDLVALLGSPEVAAAQAKEALVLELLRQARIGQSKAAELLGVTRWELLDLMVEHQIPSGPATIEELHEEMETLRQLEQRR